MISGDVSDAGRTWSFADPCLTASEARDIVAWLEGVASGVVLAVDYAADDESKLVVFTEPHIAVSLAASTGDQVTVRGVGCVSGSIAVPAFA